MTAFFNQPRQKLGAAKNPLALAPIRPRECDLPVI
jgi:hypothetical protein